MKRKLFSAILFGALLTASTSGLTSCKDYDDDISNLQSQIDKLATADQLSAKVSELQAAISAAQSAAESKAAAAETVAKAAQSAADAAATAAAKAQSTADGASQAAKDAAAAAAAANEVGKAAQAAVDKLAAEAATKAELEAAKEAAAAAVKAIQDAHATDKAAIEKAIADSKTELLEKINANTAALAALDTRLTAVEAQLKAIIDGEGEGSSLDTIAAEVEAIGEAVEELLGAFTMATSIDFYEGITGYDTNLNFWKVTEALKAEFPSEAGLVKEDAYSFEKGKERVYEDSVLVRVNPVDATLDKDAIVLMNSQGKELSSDLVECVEARAYESSTPMTKAAGNGTGLWVVKFKATDKLISDEDVQKEFKAETMLGGKQIAFALGIDEADNADRRLVTKYELGMGYGDATHATTFDVTTSLEKKNVSNIKNRFKTSDDNTQVAKDVYKKDLAWRWADYVENNKNKGAVDHTTVVTPDDDEKNYNADNTDDRNGKAVILAEVGKSITISFPAEKPIKGFYVTLDYKRAVESASSEINAWNTYEYENVAKISKEGKILGKATLQNGNVGYIQVNDLKDYSNVGDIIGFRVFAVNLDGTLVDPDGTAFYVGFGESDVEVDEKEIGKVGIVVKNPYKAANRKPNLSEIVSVEEAFSGVSFNDIVWECSKGIDNATPVVGNHIAITYYSDAEGKNAVTTPGSNGQFWEDVKYLRADIVKPTYLVDNQEYTLTANLVNKVGTSLQTLRKVVLKVKKVMPTTLPEEFAIQREALQSEEQVVVPTRGTNISTNLIENGEYNAAGVWTAYINDTKTPNLKGVYNLKTPWAGTINLNAIYRFKDGKYLSNVGEVSYIVEKSAENAETDATAAKDQTFSKTSRPALDAASFAGNFINGNSYTVKAVYKYADISRRALKKGTQDDWKAADGEANKVWSAYADDTRTGLSGSDLAEQEWTNESNDYNAKETIPSVKLMPWSSEKYLAFDWNKKCVAPAKDAVSGVSPALAAVYEPNNEIAVGNENATFVIDLHNIQVFLGNEIKNLGALNMGSNDYDMNASNLSNVANIVTWNLTKDPKHGWTSSLAGGREVPNIWTRTADGTINPYFKPTAVTNTTVTLTQIKDKFNTPIHNEELCMEMVDCFGNKRVVALPLRVVEKYSTVYTPEARNTNTEGTNMWTGWSTGLSVDQSSGSNNYSSKIIVRK